MYIKKILWAIALIGLVIAGFIANYIYGAMFSSNTAFEEDYKYIFISNEANYNDVRLQLEPLLEDISDFDALAKQKKYVSNVRPGKYKITKGMNNNDIINSIRSGNVPVKLAFNNQNSLESLAGRVAIQIDADSIALLEAMTDSEFLSKKGFNKATALGMYLPNSYELFWNTTPKVFVERMHKEYNRFWNAGRLAKAKALNYSPDQVMALASIVYEESKQKTEQPRVAGVYINRLKRRIPLQADPTIKFAAYQLPQYKNTIIRRVLNVHKDIDSPYNTYKNAGLPPGLITMPDLSAIDAVLNYEKHQYIYFAADPKRIGFHRFAKTLSQHNINARNYHRYLDQQGIRK
ncbi:endolytic transglycosylase MltG [Winogradskyella immobilis]|uniref:Endolytic murein transglycosylase n=1 Tax=Winogradskyella immobilis TaxID=2816852 RepID=A0ABS8EPJ1_9FLAO|nr:endolytic transglycosylase MltG [Winogradskyella immobilis]MCC1484777.1 endolytic transglycosylase MltG [Winogradskyella immobilis]MCG0016869.1 endolytic transglycosylase MltG [Winogradskyella immobilis]